MDPRLRGDDEALPEAPGGSGRLTAKQDARNQPLRDGPVLPPEPFPAGPPVLPNRRPSAREPRWERSPGREAECTEPKPFATGRCSHPTPSRRGRRSYQTVDRAHTNPGGSGRLTAKRDARNQALRDGPALPPKPFPAGPPVLPNRRPSAHKPRWERSPGREAGCTEPNPSRRAGAPTKTLPGEAAGPTINWGWPNARPPPASCSESPAPSLHTQDGCADPPEYSRSRSP